MKTMKTVYCTPEMFVHVPNMLLMLSKESNPNDDDILGKERGDDNEFQKEADSWSDGLW